METMTTAKPLTILAAMQYAKRLHMIGFQQKISVVMGSVMIISVLFPALFKNQYNLNKSWFSFVGKLKSTIGSMFSIRSYSSLFFSSSVRVTAPTGDEEEGFSTGKVTYEWNNYFEVSLHLDQKKPIYIGSPAHSGEYEGELVENEEDE